MDEFKLCSDGEFMPVSLPCPPPYSGPYYYYPYENIPLPPDQASQGNTDSPLSSSSGGAPISSGAVAAIIIIISFMFLIICLIAFKFRSRFILGNIARFSSSRNARTSEFSGEFLVNDIHGDMLVNIVGCGLEEKLVSLLPVCEYVGLMKEGKVDAKERHECAVCLCLFEEKEIVRVLPKCHHIFHLPCIDKWFESHANCPLCRERITLQTIQLYFNPHKHDDHQPLPNDLSSHPHLNDHQHAVIISPPLRDAICLHNVNHQQEFGRLPYDLQNADPHQNIFLAGASAASIVNPRAVEAADQPHVGHAAAGSHLPSDDRKKRAAGFMCSFEDLCDQQTIPIPAATAESAKYKHDAESKGDKNASNEAANRDENCIYTSDGQFADQYDHRNPAAVSDRSQGAAADDQRSRSLRESNKIGLFVNPNKSQEDSVGDCKTAKTSFFPIHGFEKALHNSAHHVLLSMISSPYPSTSYRPFSTLLRKSLSTGSLVEWDAKASHAFHGTTREML